MKGLPIKIVAIIVIVAACFALVPNIAKAEEGNKFVNFLKKILIYPFRVTKESTEVVTETTTKSAEMVVETGKAAAGVATGDIEKTKDLVIEPVKGSAETAVTAIEGSVKVPIEAAEEEEVDVKEEVTVE